MLQDVPPIDVPAEQRMEYNNVLEQLHRACTDLDHKLPMLFAVLKKEDVVRRLVIIVSLSVQKYRIRIFNVLLGSDCYSTAGNDLFGQHSLPRHPRYASYHAPASAAYERQLCHDPDRPGPPGG